MSLEIEQPTPPSREAHRFHPWHERPLTERQYRHLLARTEALAGTIVVAYGAALWLSGWPARWIAEPVMATILVALYAQWRDGRG